MRPLNELLHLPFPLVLASKSPRRRALLHHVGFEFDVVDPDVDEDAIDTMQDHRSYVQQLAYMKAVRGSELVTVPSIVIGSDTTVVLEGEVLNKPLNKDHAVEMLHKLSGNTHTVHTGLALVRDRSNFRVASRETRVTFRNLDPDEIHAYVEGGSPLDKAGAYGIQDDYGAVFVSRVEGCYYTIVGLPLELLYTELRSFVEELASA